MKRYATSLSSKNRRYVDCSKWFFRQCCHPAAKRTTLKNNRSLSAKEMSSYRRYDRSDQHSTIPFALRAYWNVPELSVLLTVPLTAGIVSICGQGPCPDTYSSRVDCWKWKRQLFVKFASNRYWGTSNRSISSQNCQEKHNGRSPVDLRDCRLFLPCPRGRYL